MDINTRANQILQVQQDAVKKLKVTGSIKQAIEKIAIAQQDGRRIITTGMGKAGIIAKKMSATLASIGFPSFYVQPAEAAHGDIGRIAPDDIVVVFSNSGRTGEVVNMIITLHNVNDSQNYVITIGSNSEPKIPHNLAVSYGKIDESCVVKKVPSTSTTLMLIIADIIAITAAESIGLDDDWFKLRHPGGAIGKSYRENDA